MDHTEVPTVEAAPEDVLTRLASFADRPHRGASYRFLVLRGVATKPAARDYAPESLCDDIRAHLPESCEATLDQPSTVRARARFGTPGLRVRRAASEVPLLASENRRLAAAKDDSTRGLSVSHSSVVIEALTCPGVVSLAWRLHPAAVHHRTGSLRATDEAPTSRELCILGNPLGHRSSSSAPPRPGKGRRNPGQAGRASRAASAESARGPPGPNVLVTTSETTRQL